MSPWTTRALVLFTHDVTASSPYGRSRTYRAGERREMLLRSEPGKPLTRATWWSSTDPDTALILGFDAVAVLDILGPIHTTCTSCERGGQIERGDDGRSYLDISQHLAQKRWAAEKTSSSASKKG